MNTSPLSSGLVEEPDNLHGWCKPVWTECYNKGYMYEILRVLSWSIAIIRLFLFPFADSLPHQNVEDSHHAAFNDRYFYSALRASSNFSCYALMLIILCL